MDRPDSVPENIWETILLFSQILNRKRDNALATPRLACLSYTATQNISQGEKNDRYEHRNEATDRA